MGDNRDNSMDSRYWGFVPLASIKGRPWVIYFSYKAERDAWQKTGVPRPPQEAGQLRPQGPLGPHAPHH